MRINRKYKLKKSSLTQDLSKNVENGVEATSSTSGGENVADPKHDALKSLKPSPKNKAKNAKQVDEKIGQNVTGSNAENGISSQNSVSLMKELQIKLTRCDYDSKVQDFDSGNHSGVEVSDVNSKRLGKAKPKGKGRKPKSVKNNTPEATARAKEEDEEVQSASESRNSDLSETKEKPKARGKRSKKNFRDGNEETINIPVEEGSAQSEYKMHDEEMTKEKSYEDSPFSVDVTENVKSVPNQTGKGRKRKKQEDNKNEDDVKPAKVGKKEKEEAEKPKSSKEKIPDVTALDFSNDTKSLLGKEWNFKISSWNVNGIRAWLEKNGISYLHHEKPDIFCIQETKCSDDQLPEEIKNVEGYHTYWLSGDKDGYSGVGLLSKEEPIKITYGIGIEEFDDEGRVITAEYEKFYLVAAYVPNAGRKLVRLAYRMKWDKDFLAYLKKLDAEKPVILCGDLNVAHEEIDLANPKTNKKNAGFTKEEREGFSTLLEEGGFTDTFRYLYPITTRAYTFWTYMMNARAKDIGWRLDYFVISERLQDNLCDSVIRKDVYGSDHCPITLFLSL